MGVNRQFSTGCDFCHPGDTWQHLNMFLAAASGEGVGRGHGRRSVLWCMESPSPKNDPTPNVNTAKVEKLWPRRSHVFKEASLTPPRGVGPSSVPQSFRGPQCPRPGRIGLPPQCGGCHGGSHARYTYRSPGHLVTHTGLALEGSNEVSSEICI